MEQVEHLSDSVLKSILKTRIEEIDIVMAELGRRGIKVYNKSGRVLNDSLEDNG